MRPLLPISCPAIAALVLSALSAQAGVRVPFSLPVEPGETRSAAFAGESA